MLMSPGPHSPPEFLTDVLGTLASDHPTRPYVTLTFAQTIDGMIAAERKERLHISGPESYDMTHWMRTMHDAILCGINAALLDDPQLKVYRLPQPPPGSPEYNQPRPVILDSQLRLPPTCKLLQNYNSQRGRRPWVMTSHPKDHLRAEWLSRKKILESHGATIIVVSSEGGFLSIHDILHNLRDRGIRSVMVEGGAQVIASFLGTVYPDAKTGINQPVVDMVILAIGSMFAGCRATPYSLTKFPDLQYVRAEVFGNKDVVLAVKPVGKLHDSSSG